MCAPTPSTEAPMAWITEKSSSFMVRWRDAETGRTRSRSCRTRADAEMLALEATRLERRSQNASQGTSRSRSNSSGPTARDATISLANYLRRIIRQDAELTQSSRETYGHNIRNHIDGTPLGE